MISLKDERERNRVVHRVTFIGMVLNLLLSVLKIAVGLLARSQAVVADGIHSFSDLASDLGVLIGLQYWSKPRDQDHPYGHGRIELVVTCGIGLLLFGVGIGIIAGAVQSLTLHASPSIPDPIAFYVSVFSIVAKEWLYHYTHEAGVRTRSSALTANAWHHRSDALSSIPAALSVLAGMIRPEWGFVDAVGAVAVSLLILQASLKIMKPALGHLVDAGAPTSVCREMQASALLVEGVCTAHALRTRYLGTNLAVDLHITVDPSMSVCRGHAISQEVEERLRENFESVTDVVVHLEPNCLDCRYGDTLQGKD